MKKRQLYLFLVFLLAACTPPAASENMPAKQAATDYKSWTRANPAPLEFPAWLAALCRMPSPDEQARLDSPHSVQFSNIYVNPTGAAMLSQTGERVFPIGSIIVKEKLLHADDKIADALGIMIKHEQGYNPAGGDWEYAYLDENSQMQGGIEAGKQCQACHLGTTIDPTMAAQYAQSGEQVSRKARDSVFSIFPIQP